MSLRLRLVVAFFLLSVVPLAAVTFYTYRSNAEALREAAEREADLLTYELSQRMQLVTAQLSERVEHLMDIQELQSELQAAVVAAESRPATSPPAQPAVLTAQAGLGDQIARSLGEAAMLLNNVELQGLRGGGGRGRQGPPPPRPPGSLLAPAPVSVGPVPSAAVATPAPEATVVGRGERGDPTRSSGQTRPASPRTRPVDPTSRGGARGDVPPSAIPPPPPPPASPAAPAPPSGPATSGTPGETPKQKLMIDLGPIRRDLFRQIMPEGRPEDLTPEQRQRLFDEINQRMMGIVQGIQLGAKELQKKAEEAQRTVQALPKAGQAATIPKETTSDKARVATKTAGTASTRPETAATAMKRKSSLTGNRLDVMMERDGEIVRQANAEINLPNLLMTVFSTTRKERGEVPFAIGRDGQIYARTDQDRTTVRALGDVAKPAGPPTARLNDWIVFTTEDPSGSGLRLGIARPVGDSLASLRRTSARNAGLGLLFIAVALVGIVPLSSRLTRNLSTLSDGVRRIAEGDYSARVPVKAMDEVGQLAVAFNQMAEDVEKHQRTAIEQERMKRELELGRQIQNEMLPHAPLRLGLTEIKGVSVPAREVGGDFFNYFELSDGQIALLVGDVSGKGVGAALLMANIQASLRTRLALGQNLSAIANEIDRDIEDNSPGPLYATLFVGILDPATRRLQYVNAGHHPQYVLRKGGGLERMESTGLPVGLFAGRGHSQQVVQLAAGDLIFFYTDGCVEAESETDEMFGAERLEALLASHAVNRAGDVLQEVESGVSAFRGRREPFDDATMMAVKVG